MPPAASKTVRPVAELSETQDSSGPGPVAMLQTSPKRWSSANLETGTASSNSTRSTTQSLSLSIFHPNRGKEVIILTRDPDVLEQYVKVLHLIKEHYRSMLVAERYAANTNAMPFREVPVQSDGKHVSPFSGSSVLELETTDLEFNPLSAREGLHRSVLRSDGLKWS
jgi:hypothetical protein